MLFSDAERLLKFQLRGTQEFQKSAYFSRKIEFQLEIMQNVLDIIPKYFFMIGKQKQKEAINNQCTDNFKTEVQEEEMCTSQ